VSLFVCDVSLDSFAVKSIVFSGLFKQCFGLSEYGGPVLNGCDVFVEVLAACESFREVFEDVVECVDSFNPLPVLDVN